MPETSNPTELRTAAGFGILYAIVLFISSWVSEYAGKSGLYGVAAIAGLTDVDAITLSSLRLFGLGKIGEAQVATIITIAFLSNLSLKLVLTFAIGGRTLGMRCLPPMLATGIGTAAALILI
jgi:uncharacterized membrane protein (DUF4010 family)